MLTRSSWGPSQLKGPSRKTEILGHHKVCGARIGGSRTSSRTTDANLHCALPLVYKYFGLPLRPPDLTHTQEDTMLPLSKINLLCPLIVIVRGLPKDNKRNQCICYQLFLPFFRMLSIPIEQNFFLSRSQSYNSQRGIFNLSKYCFELPQR